MKECAISINHAIKYYYRLDNVIRHIISIQRRPETLRTPHTHTQPLDQAIMNARRLLSLLLDSILQAKSQSSQERNIRWSVFTPLMQAQYFLSTAILALFPKDPAMRKFSLILPLLTNTARHMNPIDQN